MGIRLFCKCWMLNGSCTIHSWRNLLRCRINYCLPFASIKRWAEDGSKAILNFVKLLYHQLKLKNHETSFSYSYQPSLVWAIRSIEIHPCEWQLLQGMV